MIELESRQRMDRRVQRLEHSLRRRPALVLPSVLLLALVCCTRAPRTSAPANALTVAVHIPARADSKPIPGGVVIDVESSAGAGYQSTSVSSSSGGIRTEVTLNGKRFEVVGDELQLGEDRYGPLRAGMLVRITTEGVYIDGKRAEPMH